MFSWDTPGQFVVQTPTGQVLAGATPHAPLAVIFPAGRPISGQNRQRGAANARHARPMRPAYLEGIGALGTGNTITVADAVTRGNGTNNDSALWVTSADIFGPIRKRSDFKTDVEAMLSNVATHLNPDATGAAGNWTQQGGWRSDAAETAGSVAKLYLDSGVAGCNRNFFRNWATTCCQARQPGEGTARAVCYAVLVFGGERLPAQTATRWRHPPKPTSQAIYLEAPSATFGTTSDQTGPTDFVATPGHGPDPLHQGTHSAGGAGLVRQRFRQFRHRRCRSSRRGQWHADTGPARRQRRQRAAVAASGTPTRSPAAGRTIRSYYTFRFCDGGRSAGRPRPALRFLRCRWWGDIGDTAPNRLRNRIQQRRDRPQTTFGAPFIIVERHLRER